MAGYFSEEVPVSQVEGTSFRNIFWLSKNYQTDVGYYLWLGLLMVFPYAWALA